MRSFWTKIILTFLIVFLAYAFYRRHVQSKPSEFGTESSSEVSYDISEDTSFLEFYDRFHKDTLFQKESIAFPLKRIDPQEESTDTIWSVESWKIHKPYNDMDGTFQRTFTGNEDIVVEQISDATGQFNMIRQWTKLSSGWHLTYYQPMGMYE